MRKFFSSDELSYEVADAVLLADGYPLDGEMLTLSYIHSVEFNENTVIFSISSNHQDYIKLLPKLKKYCLVFISSVGAFLPFSKNDIADNKLLSFLEQSLSGIGLNIDTGRFDKDSLHGQWSVPESGVEPHAHPFDFLRLIESCDMGLIESMYGHSQLKGFEFSLEMVRLRKKQDVEDVAPCIWIDRVLLDPATEIYFMRINILSRSGMKYGVISSVIPNTDLQDSKKLTEWVLSRTPSVVDRKLLGAFVKELLRHAFTQLDAQVWIRTEGWIRGEDGAIEGCACGQELLLAPGVDPDRFHMDIVAPRLAQIGTLGGWNDAVLAPVSRNFTLLGAIQLGMAGLMVDLVPGVSSSVINFFGGAGRGKTLLLSTVASLYGNTGAPGQSKPGQVGKPMIETFGSTQRALQAKGQQTSVGPFLIDEIGSNTYGDLDNYVYDTGNGSGRTKLSGNGDVLESPSKTLFVLTTGEVSIMSLVSRNAKQGIFDRGVDINVGGGDVSFEGEDTDDFAFLQDDIKKALSAAIPHQYGTVAPAFVRALLAEMKSQSWELELANRHWELADALPRYVSQVGPDRVLWRFALAALAGEVALRNGVFSEQYVDSDDLFNGVLVCAHRWVTTRWNHLYVLADALCSQKRIPYSTPKSGLVLYRHKAQSGGMPTLMIAKDFMEEIFPGRNQVETISKRFKEDNLIVRSDPGRHTVGKEPYYHLKTEWLLEHQIEWSEERERFEAIELPEM
ncbi:DUF927 domain-containing protein [Pseudomonas brassicacearum]|uniref:DUF927 domain-containing protein n=1 Tax=Pseudomonas brassicacearum TaxID=930166 RepID=A0A423GV45_9PSED|nr:DUF927 domain-containing protein [Pseudomonas brassicacearum]RON01301.1 hypothetical protein BK658_09055 [Pseudomonas brassicacearum]